MKSTEAVYAEAGVAFVETQSGRFYANDPYFVTKDIAHALSMNCRFNGHVTQFYSVAEHSVMVAQIMADFVLGDPMEGLLHDATEAYLTDVPAPFKQFLPDMASFDGMLEGRLRKQYALPPKKTPGCKTADWLALFIEAYWLMPSKGEIFLDPQNLRPWAMELKERYRPMCHDPHWGRHCFMQMFHHLEAEKARVHS